MNGLCDVNCDICDMRTKCKGCEATSGKPFGGTCVVSDMSFVLVCEYGEGGSNPEIILYKKR